MSSARRQRIDGDITRLQFHHLTRPRQIIGPLPIDHQSRIGGRDLIDRASETRQHTLKLSPRRSHVALRHDLALKVQRIGLAPELHGELVDLARIEHPPAQLGRLADADRQHAGRQRIERAAVPDLDLAEASLPQVALYRRDGLRRSQPQRLVENDPAIDHSLTSAPDRRLRWRAKRVDCPSTGPAA